MTALSYTAPCPSCGSDALWHATYVTGSGGSSWEFDCPRCDWTFTAQRTRWCQIEDRRAA